MFNSLNQFSSSIFCSEKKTNLRENIFTRSNRKRNGIELPKKTICYQLIEKNIYELWKEFVNCFEIQGKDQLFETEMIESPNLLIVLKKRFEDFLQKYEIKVSKKDKNLISYNEEGSYIFNFQEIWIIYIMINKDNFTLKERCNLINLALGYDIDFDLLYKLFKYLNDTYKVKKSDYSGIMKQSSKYKDFIKKYETNKNSKEKTNELRKRERFVTPEKVKKVDIKTNNKEDFREIIEEEDFRSDNANDTFTFIPDPSSNKKNILKNKYILTPVRVSSKNVKSCEKVLHELRKDKSLISDVMIKPNKHLMNAFNKLTYKTEVFEEKLKDMLDKKEVNFNLTDLEKIRSNQVHLNKEKHINVTNFSCNNRLDVYDPKEIKVISNNFNGNNNFALLEVKNGKRNEILLTPLKRYKNLTERKIVENDLQLIYSDKKLNNFIYHPLDEKVEKILNKNLEVGIVKKNLFNSNNS